MAKSITSLHPSSLSSSSSELSELSTMSRDYMKNPWNSRGYWGPSPETTDNSDNS